MSFATLLSNTGGMEVGEPHTHTHTHTHTTEQRQLLRGSDLGSSLYRKRHTEKTEMTLSAMRRSVLRRASVAPRRESAAPVVVALSLGTVMTTTSDGDTGRASLGSMSAY